MWSWLRARDPHWFALRRAARAAVVVAVNFAIGSEVIGNAQVATFVISPAAGGRRPGAAHLR